MSAFVMLFCLLMTGCGKKSKTAPVVPEFIPITEEDMLPELTPSVSEISDTDLSEQDDDNGQTVSELTVDFDKVKAIDPSVTMYAVSNVNVRKGPSTDYESIGMIKLGEAIEAIGQDEGGWYEFIYKGNTVFACDDYLSDEEPAMPTPAEKEENDKDGDKDSTDKTDKTQIAEDTENKDLIEGAAEQSVAEIEQMIAELAAQEAGSTEEVGTDTAVDPTKVLIIGDSRSVMMKNATGGGGCNWICKIGKGYKWFESTALPEAEDQIGQGTRVVIALGVNDIGNVNRYARLVNQKAKEWADKGAVTYYVSVNPVQNISTVSENQVVFFNSSIQSQLEGVKWIDTHSYLMDNGYVTTDGLHFNNETSRRIFQVIMDSL